MNITTIITKFKDFGEEGLDTMHLDRSQRAIQKTTMAYYRYHHLVPPPLIKRHVSLCGNCLSHQQKKRDNFMAFTKFSKEINQRMRDTLDFPSYTIWLIQEKR